MAFPEFDWKLERFSWRGKKSTQRWYETRGKGEKKVKQGRRVKGGEEEEGVKGEEEVVGEEE